MRHSGDFARAIRSGSRAGSQHLVVHLLAPVLDLSDPASAPAQVGFVVSKAVGGAVQRNRVKRRLRDIMRSRVGDLPDGTLAVVRALPSSSGASYTELSDAVVRSIDMATRRQRRS